MYVHTFDINLTHIFNMCRYIPTYFGKVRYRGAFECNCILLNEVEKEWESGT
jgi:hypothetical protein